MRIVFMGSADMACECLKKLLAANCDTLAGIITQPARPKGRSLKISPCPVHDLAKGTGIPVFTPDDVNSDASINMIKELRPDLAIVVAYGQILKPFVLSAPASGCINVHASLLPKYRGAAPIEWAIARGEKITGVSTMFINEKMDSGDIIIQDTEQIKHDDTGGSLRARLAEKGAELLIQTLHLLRSGSAPRIPQVHQNATYAPKLDKNDGRMDWAMEASEIYDRVRAFNPRPGCFFKRCSGDIVRVFKTRVETPVKTSKNPLKTEHGIVLEDEGEGPLVMTGKEAVRLLEVQPEGKKRMDGKSFLCGYAMRAGERLYFEI